MTEKELYERIVVMREVAEALIEAAMDLPATIELCVFTGKLGAVADVLYVLESAGVPVADPDKEPHPLENN